MVRKSIARPARTGRLEVVDERGDIRRRMDVDQQVDVIGLATELHQRATPGHKTIGERGLEVREQYRGQCLAPISGHKHDVSPNVKYRMPTRTIGVIHTCALTSCASITSMQTGRRFRLYFTSDQGQTLLRWMECQRHINDDKMREDGYFRTFARKSLSLAGQHGPIDQKYAHFIGEDTPWLREVPSVALRNGAVLWRQAYALFFRGLAARPVLHSRLVSGWLIAQPC